MKTLPKMTIEDYQKRTSKYDPYPYDMKLGVTYSVFDGIELLPYSIANIRPYVDYIQVVWQEKNWYGTKTIKNEDLETLYRLSAEKKIDKLIKFDCKVYAPNPPRAGEIERSKRIFGKEQLAAVGCSHYLDIDVDEFFEAERFQMAKEYIKYWDVDYTTCHYVNYAKSPIYREKMIGPGYSVFICKFPKEPYGDIQWLPVYQYLDDSRKFFSRDKNDVIKHFELDEIFMHHFAYWRKDMMFKFQNTSRFNLDRGALPNLVGDINALDKTGVIPAKYFHLINDWQFEKVENTFNLPLEW